MRDLQGLEKWSDAERMEEVRITTIHQITTMFFDQLRYFLSAVRAPVLLSGGLARSPPSIR
ncbi:hypothetical protein GYMLUDRAFT_37617 [Collybiopsis luxurians FD-317 M1]|nr:hypothetical protein GYMLUDRAFT_37617 [Collybiopsis luxurians FD-317 M1]